MKRKYMNSDKGQWKYRELITLISEVDGGTNIQSQLTFYNTNRNRRLGLGPSARVSTDHEWSAAPWATRLPFQGLPHWWRVAVVAPRVDRFLAVTHQCRAQGWTGRKQAYRFSNLWYDPTGKRTMRTTCGGEHSTNSSNKPDYSWPVFLTA